MADEQCILVLQNFIDGKFVGCEQYIDSYDPSRGEVYCKVPDSGTEQVDMAVEAAKKAFKSWSLTTPDYRAQRMRKLADLIEDHLDEFALAESRDQGKTVTFAKTVDIPRACLNLRMFASAILHTASSNRTSILHDVGAVNYTLRSPVGVAGLISPWNLPLYLLTFKIAPAVGAGNTVVCKPSELTSVTAWMMAQLLNEAGFPDGVINIVFGKGPRAGSAVVQHPDVQILSFTGSTATGQIIREQSAPFCKKLSLELGGKNACIIFEDADLDKCVPTTIRELIVGQPEESTTNVGALVSKEHLAKVIGYVNLAISEGGSIVCGEGRDDPPGLPTDCQSGYYMRPTVITGLTDSARCMQEEIFGPVVCIAPFDTEEEVIERANGVKYGLCACVWTENVSRTHRVSQRLQAGTVWCNCWLVRDLNMPFGGIKQSGVGSEGIRESLEFYTDPKTICIKV